VTRRPNTTKESTIHKKMSNSFLIFGSTWTYQRTWRNWITLRRTKLPFVGILLLRVFQANNETLRGTTLSQTMFEREPWPCYILWFWIW